MAFFDFLHIFTDLFNSIAKAWKKLNPEVKNALVHGSGVISIINEHLQDSPEVVFELIEKKFPKLSKETLSAALHEVAGKMKVAENVADPDLLTTIKNLQAYFAGLDGKFWEGAASTTSQLLSIALSPDDTPFAKITMFMEYVYRKKVKKQLQDA